MPRWTRWVALAWIAWQLPRYLFPDRHLDPAAWYVWAEVVVWTVALGTAVYSQAYRYRRVSNAVQRRQIKWVVFGLTVAVVGTPRDFRGAGRLRPFSHVAGCIWPPFLFGFAIIYSVMLLIPLCIGVAILRYQLWDIDVVINRTLVYGALTACVVAPLRPRRGWARASCCRYAGT